MIPRGVSGKCFRTNLSKFSGSDVFGVLGIDQHGDGSATPIA